MIYSVQKDTGLQVIQKILTRGFFQSELAALRRLKGDNRFIQLVECYRDNKGNPVIVYEYVPFQWRSSSQGHLKVYMKNLLEVTRTFPFKLKQKAVEEMHRKGIVHVDLKESNTLFDPVSGKVVILDFGSCIIRGLVNYNIRTTKGYSAPELSHRNAGTCAIDMWSVGAIFAYQVSHLLDSSHKSCLDLRDVTKRSLNLLRWITLHCHSGAPNSL